MIFILVGSWDYILFKTNQIEVWNELVKSKIDRMTQKCGGVDRLGKTKSCQS